MGKHLRWMIGLTVAGAVLGAAFGFLVSRSIGCDVLGAGLPPEAACYEVFGFYLSAQTYYTVAVAVIGAGIGLGIGLLAVAPVLLWRRKGPADAPHPLEHPVIWFGLQLLELFVVTPPLLFWVPDPGEWPEAARWAVFLIALGGLAALNYAIRRRFIPR